MLRQYKRAYNLTIQPVNEPSRYIDQLRVTFEIKKSLLGYPNLAKIDVYNISRDTLAALQKKYTKITLNAGYEGGVGLIFKGEIRNVLHQKQREDRVATIFAGDSERSWQNATFNKTLSENVKLQEVIEEVAKTFKDTTLSTTTGIPKNTSGSLRGRTLSGSSRNIMDKFADEYGFDWSIQDGEMQIIPTEGYLEDSDAILIGSATGMIGSPTVTEIGADVTTLMNPKLTPGKAFRIESVFSDVRLGDLNFREARQTISAGEYKILEVILSGDSREGSWVCDVTGRTLYV